MTTTPVQNTSPVGAPPVVHGGHPRDALIPGDFGIETVEDVVNKRGLGEDAGEIAEILTDQPKYATHKPTPEEALDREKNRLAYEELKNLWEKIGQEDDAELRLLNKKVTDIEAAMTYWRGQGKPEKADTLQPQLEEAQRAVAEYQSSVVNETQRAQLIAYGKKRLAQLVAIADYLEHGGRKERMGGMITKLERQKELLGRQISAKGQEKQRVEEELDKENKKGDEKNQVIIDGLADEKALLENDIAQLNEEASLIRNEEEMIEKSIEADGIRGADASQNITLANVVAQRDGIVSKLRALGVAEQEINELVIVSHQQGDATGESHGKSVQVLGTETGESATEMSQIMPSRAGSYTHIKKITSLSAPNVYVIELDTTEKCKKRQLLVSAKPGHAVELLSGRDEASASEVNIRTVGETKVIVCEETTEGTGVGAQTNTYRIYNERTGEQLGQEICIEGYIRFERELLEGFDYITEIEYGVGVDMKKGLINISTGTVIIDKEQGGINRRYNLLTSDRQSQERKIISEKFRKHEEMIGSVDGLIASLQQKYYVLVQTDGCLCLVDKNTNKKMGYLTPKSSRSYTEQQGYMTMVYLEPTGSNMSDGSIDISDATGTYMTLPGEKVLQEQVSRGPSLRNFAETLRIEKEYAFLQRETDKMRVVFNYTTGQTQELGKGDIKLDFPRDLLCIGDGDIDKLYYIRQEEDGSHTIDGVCQTNDLHRMRLLGTNKESDVLAVWIPNPTSKSRQYYLYNKKIGGTGRLYKSSKEEDIGARKTLRLYTGDGPFATIGGPDVTIVSDSYRDIVEVKYK